MEPSTKRDEKKLSDDDNSENCRTPPKENSFVRELNPFEIRWHYKDKKGSWIPFGGRDSLLIEMKYRINIDENLGDDFPEKQQAIKMCNNPVVVLDGYYELVFEEKQIVIKALYWKDDWKKIVRGRWFVENDWIPIDGESDAIENAHLKQFQGKEFTYAPTLNEKGQPKVLHSLTIKKFGKIQWYATDNVTLIGRRWWTHYLKTSLSKLRRGFHTSATLLDAPLPVKYLVFVVHGIGQKTRLKKIVGDCNLLRAIADDLWKQTFFDAAYRPMFLPVEWRTKLKLDEGLVDAITPSEMETLRSLLNATVMDLMYYNSPKYRAEVTDGLVSALNTLHDKFLAHNSDFEKINGEISIVAHSLGAVMCYDVVAGWSPLQQYEEFVSQRLGHVMESPFVSNESKFHLEEFEKARTNLIEREGGLLKFLTLTEADAKLHLTFNVSIKHLFTLGSPLAVFLALRGQTGKKVFDHWTPLIYNIFHPYDPVAYRLEPLVHPLYACIRPLRIQNYDAKNKIPYSEIPMEVTVTKNSKRMKTEGSSASERSATSDTFNEKSTISTKAGSDSHSSHDASPSSPKAESKKSKWSFSRYFRRQATGDQSAVVKDAVKAAGFESTKSFLSNGSKTLDHDVLSLDFLSRIPAICNLPYRFDYIMRETRFHYAFLSPVLSHGYYWYNEDVIMFILMQIYRSSSDRSKTFIPTP